MHKNLKTILVLLLLLTCITFTVSCGSKKTDSQPETTNCSSHQYSDWQLTKEPTCYNEGEKTRTCNTCGNIETSYIPSQHTWQTTVIFFNPPVIDGPFAKAFCTTCNATGILELDAKADNDGDGVTNEDEYNMGLNYLLSDTDNDGLSDGDELNVYSTDPLVMDTDGDGAYDGKEVVFEFDPTTPDTSFLITNVPAIDNSNTPDTVKPSINVEITGVQLNSLSVKRNYSFKSDTLGYIGDAYDYSIEGQIASATIIFEFDESMLQFSSLPTFYIYNEEGSLTPIATTIEGNVASAVVSELSTFVLLDKKAYESRLNWIDILGLNGKIYTDIEVVFVIDDSTSMMTTDRYYERLNVTKNLISQLPNGSKIGVVEFDSTTVIHTTELTTDRDLINSYLSTEYFTSNGETYMYEAINSSFDLFQSEEETTLKIMVVLTDSEATTTSLHSSVVATAKTKNVHIYTVGLGSTSTSYFNNYLSTLATNTGGQFYIADDAEALAEIYESIGDKIDINTDTDNDGLSDYFELNAVLFNGTSLMISKDNSDTDDDGLLDSEEATAVVVYHSNGTQMTVLYMLRSDPSNSDSDGDGVLDIADKSPLNDNIQ